MKRNLYAEPPILGARAQADARVKRAHGRLLSAALGLCAEIVLALGFAAVGFALSLLRGW